MTLLKQLAVVAAAAIGFALAAPQNQPRPSEASTFYQGFDLSSLHILEQGNVIYKDTARNNETRAAEDILGDGGMNTVRLRLWVDPPPGQYDLAYTLSQAQRFYKKGYKIYLDFHFANSWADPGQQPTPSQWNQGSVTTLASDLRTYVKNALVSFQNGGVTLDIVSLGNEIRNGMLWPLGKADPTISNAQSRASNFGNFATLWAAARAGVNDAVSAGVTKPQIMIHIDNGWDVNLQKNWFSALVGSGKVAKSDWDVFGFSFYPFYGTSATLANLQTTMNTITAAYQKPAHVVETDWPEKCSGVALSDTSVPISVAGQTEWVQDIVNTVKGVNGGYGQGVSYWEPTWLNNTGLGSSCQDVLLFAGDWSGYPSSIVGYSRSSVNMFAS